MSSSMGEGRPEPLNLHAVHTTDGRVKILMGLAKVMRGDEVIVAETDTVSFVADTIKELKLRGVDHETQVIIYGVSNNPAYNGAIKHHG